MLHQRRLNWKNLRTQLEQTQSRKRSVQMNVEVLISEAQTLEESVIQEQIFVVLISVE